MSAESSSNTMPIRLVFELARADHPRLYDDLIRFHKGVKRVNRLRVLAYDGLNPWPPSYCYLKPYYLDPNTTYFEQLARGEL